MLGLDKLLEDGRRASGVQEQVLVYRKMQRLLADELPYLYLWFPDVVSVRNVRIGGMADINNVAAHQYAVDWFIKK